MTSMPRYIFVPHTYRATNQERMLKPPECPHVKATQSTLRARVRQAKQETEGAGCMKEHDLAQKKRSRNIHCTKAMISFIWASIVGFASSFNRPSSSLRTPQRRRKSGSMFFSSALMLSFSIASREAAMSDAMSNKIYTTTTTTTTTKRNTNHTKHKNPANAEHKSHGRPPPFTTEAPSMGQGPTGTFHRLALYSPILLGPRGNRYSFSSPGPMTGENRPVSYK